MRVSLLIPKRGRHERLPLCLHYLNTANAAGRHAVTVVVVDDSPQPPELDPTVFPQLTVRLVHQPAPPGAPFSRGALLHAGMAALEPTWDWCGLIDIDMLYGPTYFDVVARAIDADYVILSGNGLAAELTAPVLEHQPPFETLAATMPPGFTSPSQIAFTPAWLALWEAVFGDIRLHDGRFTGWGFEDTLPDLGASLLARAGLAGKRRIPGAWLHLHHPRHIDARQDAKNTALACAIHGEMHARLKDYLRRKSHPRPALPLLDQGAALLAAGRLSAAEDVLRHALALEPGAPDVAQLLAVALARRGASAEAVALLSPVAARSPDDHELQLNLGEALRRAGQPLEARAAFERALGLFPYFPEAHFNLGILDRHAGRHEEAARQFEQAALLRPAYAAAHFNLGNTLRDLDAPGQAVAAYKAALAVRPDYGEARRNLAALLVQLGHSPEAESHYRVVLAHDGADDEARLQLAHLLAGQGARTEALALLRSAAERRDEGRLWLQAAELAADLGEGHAAEQAYRRALARLPASADAHNGLGAVLADARRYPEAANVFAEALRIEPGFPEAARNLARVVELEGRMAEARALWDGILRRAPGDAMTRLRVETLLEPIIADHAAIAEARAQIARALEAIGPQAIPLDPATLHLHGTPPPFNLVYHGHDDLPLKRVWANCFVPPDAEPPRPPRGGAPHVGFVVTEHHEGLFLRCTARMVAQLPGLGCRATVFCGSAHAAGTVRAAVGPNVRVIAAGLAFAPFLAALRTARCDALVYWEIGSDAINYFLPFFRPAPLQLLSWGSNHTSGVPHVSHYLSSRLLETSAAQAQYSEELLLLPSLTTSYPRPPIPARPIPREQFGLAPEQHLYLCFQNPRKLHPDFDPLLGDILRGDPRGVLVLKGDRPGLRDAVLARMRRTLPDVLDRIQLLPALPEAAYLSLVAHADVVLDSILYSGANTSYEAFAAGVPVVTMPGELQRGRFTLGLYRALGLDDGVTTTPEAYVAQALALGTDPAYRAEVSARIRAAAPVLFERPEPGQELAELIHRLVG